MEDPARLFSTSKETYLSSILDRFRLTGAKYPDVESLGCNEEINRLYIDGKSEDVSLEDIVREIDGFYSRSDNMIIPIIFAYCYTIKKIAGASADELNDYKKEVVLFCSD